jgi:hypothetical protein
LKTDTTTTVYSTLALLQWAVEASTAADTEESPPKKRKLEGKAELVKSCQEKKEKKKRKEEQEEEQEEAEELASDSSYDLESHDSTRSSSSSEEEDDQEDDYKNKKMSSKKRNNSKRHEADEIDLTDMGRMVDSFRLTSVSQPPSARKKKKNVLRQGYLPSSGSPFLIYDWIDTVKCNNMLNIEVLLFQEPRTLDEFAVEIEEKGGNNQKIVISQSLPSSWLSMTHFKRAFKNIEGEDGFMRRRARQFHLHEFENLFGQEDKKDITMKQEIDLPFRCDSDFLVRGSYQGTGFWFDSWKVPRKTKKKKKSRSLEEDDDYDVVNVLTIQLVAEEKVAPKKIKKKTPKKSSRIPVYVCSSDSEDDSSEDEDRGISYDEDEDTKVRMNTTSSSKNYGRRSSASANYSTADENNMSMD